jgi:tRNA A-37 threonylcarbamoyl transferase component Bud32
VQPPLITGGDLLAAPREVGPYRLLALLGRGGMAEVYLAEHRHLAQVRAVKVLLPEVASRPGVVSRLLTEARAIARLHHPSIVEVFDCDTLADGGAFIAMEYLRGESASRWLERAGALADRPELAAALIGVAAQALGFAHRRGVVHRDVKPENVFLTPAPGGQRFALKILDFGVAKLVGVESLARTRDGVVVGTPLYMAPEQWRGAGEVDHRTDIYSLGCVLFELLSGHPPFFDGSNWDIMRAHLDDPAPSITTRAPRVPEPMARLIARMLAKPPADRPQSMEEVAGALASCVGTSPRRLGDLLEAPPRAPVGVGHTEVGDLTHRGLGSLPIAAARGASTTLRISRTLVKRVRAMRRSLDGVPRWIRAAGGGVLVIGAGLIVIGGTLLFEKDPAARPIAPEPVEALAPLLAPSAPAAPAGTGEVTAALPARPVSPPHPPVVRPHRRPPHPRAPRRPNVYLPVGD